MKNELKFYPCVHTRRDGLYLSSESVQSTGRLVLFVPEMDTHKPVNREITIRRCKWCS